MSLTVDVLVAIAACRKLDLDGFSRVVQSWCFEHHTTDLDALMGRDRGSTPVGSSRPHFAGPPASAEEVTPLTSSTLTPAPSAVTGRDGGVGGDAAGFPVPNRIRS